MQWEYIIFAQSTETIQMLNAFGKNGWEVCCHIIEDGLPAFLLKRQILPED